MTNDRVPPVTAPVEASAAETGDEGGSEGSAQGLGWLTYQSIEQREEDEEGLRLFYVATTRARDTLILSSGDGPGDNPSSPAMRLLAERFDRATGRCLAALPPGWSVRPVHVTVDAPPTLDDVARPPSVRPDLPAVIAVIQGAPVVEDAPTARAGSIP